MTDKELLELAAKAAGIENRGYCTDGYLWIGDGDYGAYEKWNPLKNDGDALRLAVKLGMNIYTNNKYIIAELLSDSEEPPIHKKEYCDEETKFAATRRAIVRAAAAIGEQMK